MKLKLKIKFGEKDNLIVGYSELMQLLGKSIVISEIKSHSTLPRIFTPNNLIAEITIQELIPFKGE